MDSLLASYASSEEEDEKDLAASASKPGQPSSFSSSSRSRVSSFFSSLPPPNSSPEQTRKNRSTSINGGNGEEDGEGIPKVASVREPSSIFASILPPKRNPKPPIGDGVVDDGPSCNPNKPNLFSSIPRPQIPGSSSLDPPLKKKVVQFRPPVIPINPKGDVDDERDEEKERKKQKRTESSTPTSSSKSLLSMMPTPRSSSTLGVLPSSGSNRRSILETEALVSNSADSKVEIQRVTDHNASYHEVYQGNEYQYDVNYVSHEAAPDQNIENYANCTAGADQYSANYVNYGGYGAYDQNAVASGYENYDNYGGYVSYGEQYGNNLGDGSPAMAMPMAEMKRAKRGKNEMPAEIVEVKQDELMKNRPREDKAKLTGIAFGPAYQPASSKGKPSKLHKRKHQISALYFDMKQKEMELAERRSRGLLTKAETHAKYGW